MECQINKKQDFNEGYAVKKRITGLLRSSGL